MGSNDGSADEKPAHRVTVGTFYLDETEVTAGQYSGCVAVGVCKAQTNVLNTRRFAYRGADERLKMENESCNLQQPSRRDHPMNCVDWYQSNRFCAWVHKRLPTEEEWEYAARGKSGRMYPWGNEKPTQDRANISGEEEGVAMRVRGAIGWSHRQGWHDGYLMTAPVTAFPSGRTPEGVYALGGNVSEWTANHPCGYQNQPCISQEYEIRGDGWGNFDVNPSWSRVGVAPMSRGGTLGFRCARDVRDPK